MLYSGDTALGTHIFGRNTYYRMRCIMVHCQKNSYYISEETDTLLTTGIRISAFTIRALDQSHTFEPNDKARVNDFKGTDRKETHKCWQVTNIKFSKWMSLLNCSILIGKCCEVRLYCRTRHKSFSGGEKCWHLIMHVEHTQRGGWGLDRYTVHWSGNVVKLDSTAVQEIIVSAAGKRVDAWSCA